jgi:hypothetical protein
MARIEGIPLEKAGWQQRFASWLSRRRFGRVAEPIAVMAHHPWVFRAYGAFELGLERARRVDPRLKELGQLKTATLVGCHF